MELEKAVEIVKLIAKCGEFEPLGSKGEWQEFVKFSATVKKDADEKLKKVKLWLKLYGAILPKETLETTLENLNEIRDAAIEVIRDKKIIPEDYEWNEGFPVHKDGAFEDENIYKLLAALPWYKGEGFDTTDPEIEFRVPKVFNIGTTEKEEEREAFTTLDEARENVKNKSYNDKIKEHV